MRSHRAPRRQPTPRPEGPVAPARRRDAHLGRRRSARLVERLRRPPDGIAPTTTNRVDCGAASPSRRGRCASATGEDRAPSIRGPRHLAHRSRPSRAGQPRRLDRRAAPLRREQPGRPRSLWPRSRPRGRHPRTARPRASRRRRDAPNPAGPTRLESHHRKVGNAATAAEIDPPLHSPPDPGDSREGGDGDRGGRHPVLSSLRTQTVRWGNGISMPLASKTALMCSRAAR